MATSIPVPAWAISVNEQSINSRDMSTVMVPLQHHLPDHHGHFQPAGRELRTISDKLASIYKFVYNTCNPRPENHSASAQALVTSHHLSDDACLLLRTLSCTLLTIRTMVSRCRTRWFRRPWETMLAQMRGETVPFLERLALYRDFASILEEIVVFHATVDANEMDKIRQRLTALLRVQMPMTAQEWTIFVTKAPPPPTPMGPIPDVVLQPPSGAPSPNMSNHQHTPSTGSAHFESPPGENAYPSGGHRGWSRPPSVSYSVPNSPVGFTAAPVPPVQHSSLGRSRSWTPTVVSFSSDSDPIHPSPMAGSSHRAPVVTPFVDPQIRGRTLHRTNHPPDGVPHSHPVMSPSPPPSAFPSLHPPPTRPDPSSRQPPSIHPPPEPLSIVPVPPLVSPMACQPHHHHHPTRHVSHHPPVNVHPNQPNSSTPTGPIVIVNETINGVPTNRGRVYMPEPATPRTGGVPGVRSDAYGRVPTTPVVVHPAVGAVPPPQMHIHPPPPPIYVGPGVSHPLTSPFTPGPPPPAGFTYTPPPPAAPRAFTPSGPHSAHPSPHIHSRAPVSGSPQYDPHSGSKHWAAHVFDNLGTTTKFHPPGPLSTCFGLDETEIVAVLARSQFVEVLHVKFTTESLVVRVYCRQSDNRARIMITYVDDLGRTIRSCHHLTSLQIRRHGATVELVHYRAENTQQPWTVWARLSFASYERLTVFATALICIKRQDRVSISLPEPLLQDWMGFEERSEFGGQIEGAIAHHVQAFQLFYDKTSKGVRVEASIRHGHRAGTPLWTGFVTRLPPGATGPTPVSIAQVAPQIVHLIGLKPHVFFNDFPVPLIPQTANSKQEGVQVIFTTREDADTFIQVAARVLG